MLIESVVSSYVISPTTEYEQPFAEEDGTGAIEASQGGLENNEENREDFGNQILVAKRAINAVKQIPLTLRNDQGIPVS